MDVMAKLADKSYDLAIVDPPYGLGDKLKPRGGMIGNSFGGMGAGTWDNSPPTAEYFRELFRVSKRQIIWGGNYFLEHLRSTQCFLVWDKNNGTNPMADCELAWTSCPGVVRKFRMHHFNAGYGKKIHPTQKPVSLYAWILRLYTQPGDRILDTHMGSGSSAIACTQVGLEMLACEIDEKYFAAAVKRIGRELQQGVML